MAEYQRLDELCHINMGQSPDSKSYNQEGKGMPFFQGNADFGVMHPETRVWCNSPTKIVEPGTLLISVRAPIGALNFAKERSCIGRGLAGITPQNGVNLKYIYYCLKGKNNELNAKGTGSTFKAIAKKALGETSVKIVPEEDQQRIIQVLDRVSSVIEARKQQLTELDNLIKARFVELFGDPADNPMGWKTKQLQEVVADDCTISYGIVQTGEDQQDGIPVFRPVDIVNHVPVRSELKKTTEEISNKYKRTLLKGREMLITVRANIGDTCIVGEEFSGCNVGRGIVPIRTKEDVIILEFLKHQIDSKHLNDRIKALAKGIALIQLNMEDLRNVTLIVPPLEQQKSFVEFAEQVDKSKVVEAIYRANALFITTLNGGNRYDIRANEV